MRRVVVIGGPGSGKSTLAAALAQRLDAPHVELDGLWWDAGWTEAGREALRERVQVRLGTDRWVVDGNYIDEVADIVWPRADLIVWLYLPRHVAARRALRRSVSRAVKRTALWNGNREALAVLSPWSIIRFIRRWPAYSESVVQSLAALAVPDSAVVRLRSDAEVAGWQSVA